MSANSDNTVFVVAVHFQGVKILKDIEKRIKGFEGTSKIMIPLSIEGQVHYLIEVRYFS